MADSSKTPLLSKGKDGAGYGASLGHARETGGCGFPHALPHNPCLASALASGCAGAVASA